MSVVQESDEKLHDIEFDEAMKSHIKHHKFVTESIEKDKNLLDIVTVMKAMKRKLFALHSKDLDKIQLKNDMIIKLCEQMTYCLLKENKPKEAIKILQELEVMQDVIKENNLKAIVYLGRTHLMLKNFNKAYDYFSTAFTITDEKTQKYIKSILDKIEMGIKEENKKSDKDKSASKTKTEIVHSSSVLNLGDIQLTPMNSKCVVADRDIIMEVLAAKQQAKSICSRKKAFNRATEICITMPCAGILTDYVQKSGNPLPTYNITKSKESLNKDIVHMTVKCHGHTESGCGSSKQKAREMAAHKMIKYLEKKGRLRLTTKKL